MQIEAYSDVAQAVRAREISFPAFGVAIFDNSKEATMGWACLSTGEPFRFRQPSELSNDAIWVCTFDYQTYNLRGRKSHNLRKADFLRSSLSHIAADHGIRLEGSKAMLSSKTLARVLERSVRIAASVYGWEDPILILKSDSLQEDIRKQLPKQQPVKLAMKTALQSALQAYSQPSWPYSTFLEDSINITLRYNRLDYAMKIMKTRIPDPAFVYMPAESFAGASQTMRLKAAMSAPSLVEATVELDSTDADTAALISYGTSPGQRNVVRKWMTDLELGWISQRARVSILSMWRSTGYAPMNPKYEIPEKLSGDEFFSLSISAGLVAECHWQCLASPYTIKNGRDFVQEIPVLATWLRAADRAICFQLARAAYASNFQIFGYGHGSIALRVERKRLEEVLRFAEDHGLSHPCFHALFEEYFNANE